MDTADEDDPVVTKKWNETSDVIDEEEGKFSQFRISEDLQIKLRGLWQSFFSIFFQLVAIRFSDVLMAVTHYSNHKNMASSVKALVLHFHFSD